MAGVPQFIILLSPRNQAARKKWDIHNIELNPGAQGASGHPNYWETIDSI